MDRTGTLTFGCPGCLCCVYTAEPCSWDPSSVRLCSHSKKLTPCELRSEKLTLPTRLSGGLDTVEVVQLQGHWFPSRLDIVRPSPIWHLLMRAVHTTLAFLGGRGWLELSVLQALVGWQAASLIEPQ